MSIKMIHLGCGGRGRWPVKLISERDDYESVALVDVNEDNLANARTVSGLGEEVCFNSLADALKAVEADAVVVITPPRLHAGQCLEAVRAGKHILVEKPFTKVFKEAHQIIEEAEKRDLKVAVCQNARFGGPVQTIHNLVSENALGAPAFALMTKFGWRPGTHHSSDDVHSYLWERGIHDFDAACFMMNSRPKRVWAHEFNPSWSPYVAGAGLHAFIEFENGATFSFLCTFASHAGGSSLRVDFEGGTVTEGSGCLKLNRPGQKEAEELPFVESAPPETILLDGFAAYINEGIEPSFSGKRNLDTVGIIEALGTASARGEVLEFQDFLNKLAGS
ncbi:MAG: Gfo/Idh/MocA family oxidoreductase [Planctomycetota bacterium]|nr:Gfo/Idh/MocA family oxidoreductase [Planctomycetota bacterium]